MVLKILQLNIFQGRHIDRIIEFVKKHDYDILQFQEVTGGLFSEGGMPRYHREHQEKIAEHINPNHESYGIDCFEMIQERLDYHGILSINGKLATDHVSYFGNATFYKKSLHLIDHKTVTLFPRADLMVLSDFTPHTIGRSVVHTTYLLGNTELHFLNAHLRWGPTPEDDEHKIREAQILTEYLTTLTGPMVLTGDFNVTPDSTILKLFSGFFTNHIRQNSITNTLNPNTHVAKHLFPAGLAVDYILTSPELRAYHFSVIKEPDLSDHYGLEIELSL